MENKTYNVAKHIRDTSLVLLGSLINYQWDDKFKIEQINSFVQKIKEVDEYFDLDCNNLSLDELRKLGFNLWSNESKVYLIPLYLFPFLKEGIQYTDINDDVIEFDKEEDNDHRFGSLYFGVQK